MPAGEEAGGVDPRELLLAAAEYARENPHTALAGALAVGFLLGGGLTPRLLASLAMFAGRKYLAEAARESLEGAVRQQIDEAISG
jgi:dienelactone hydrolase